MPIFFILVGILLIVVALNDKMSDLGGLIKDDFHPSNGSAGFSSWIIAVFVIGSLGYIKAAKPIANALLLLIVVSMLLANQSKSGSGGFFDNFTKAIKG